MRLTEEEKQRVLREVPFSDPGIYSRRIYDGNYRVVVISILSDANLGVYRRKETGERIAFWRASTRSQIRKTGNRISGANIITAVLRSHGRI